MAINGVSATDPAQQSQVNTPTPLASTENLAEDAFMQLLLAQLKNQDPLKPMDNTEFISQLAQFNSLNETMAMNKNIGELLVAQSISQGSSLIGKTVTAHLPTGEDINGEVSSLQIMGDNVSLTVDGVSIPLDAVHTVTETPTTPEGSA